jgi:hypothetical protein
MTNIASGEWGIMRRHLGISEPFSSKELKEAETLEAKFTDRQNHGFSAYDLTESLARYWDVLATGPDLTYVPSPGESVRIMPTTAGKGTWFTMDQLHRALSTQGSYATPYTWASDVISDEVETATIFPLVAHFSLQSRDPVDLFTTAILRLRLHPRTRWSTGDLRSTLRSLYGPTLGTVRKVAATEGIPIINPLDVIDGTTLKSNPVFRHYLGLLANASYQFGLDTVDYWFATPALERGTLAHILQAPAVRLIGGRWKSEAPYARQLVEQILHENPHFREPPSEPVDHLVWHGGPAVETPEGFFETLADRSIEIVQIDDELRFSRFLRRKRMALGIQPYENDPKQ